jgi:DNA-binding MarR family transcriptional regulator
MSQEDLLAIAEEVAGLMPRLARGLTSAEKDPADNLPLAQLRLCGILSEGPRPMSALSRELGVSHSALTQIADRLERASLVKRVAEANDRRIRCLQLTARGEKMMRRRREARVRRTLAVLEHLASPQRETVRTSLAILANACAAVHAAETGRGPEKESSGNGSPGKDCPEAIRASAVPVNGHHRDTRPIHNSNSRLTHPS